MIAEIKSNTDSSFAIKGELSFFNAPQITDIGIKLIKRNTVCVFDLQSLLCIDNAALAVLIAWARYANREQTKIQFINPTQKLIDMAKVGGLIKILPILQI